MISNTWELNRAFDLIVTFCNTDTGIYELLWGFDLQQEEDAAVYSLQRSSISYSF